MGSWPRPNTGPPPVSFSPRVHRGHPHADPPSPSFLATSPDLQGTARWVVSAAQDRPLPVLGMADVFPEGHLCVLHVEGAEVVQDTSRANPQVRGAHLGPAVHLLLGAHPLPGLQGDRRDPAAEAAHASLGHLVLAVAGRAVEDPQILRQCCRHLGRSRNLSCDCVGLRKEVQRFRSRLAGVRA